MADLGLRVQNRRRDLLVTRLRVQLLAEPAEQGLRPVELETLDQALRIPSGRTCGVSGPPEEDTRPQCRHALAQERVVVDEASAVSPALDPTIGGQQAEELSRFFAQDSPWLLVRQIADRQALAGFDGVGT